jgi:hypothetical protein
LLPDTADREFGRSQDTASDEKGLPAGGFEPNFLSQ